MGFWTRLRVVLEMIRFSHTVFALPFALAALLLASPKGVPESRVLLWVIVAMVAARSAAMAFNRLVDHHFDAENPRTRERALPKGTVSRRWVWGFVCVHSALFHLAAWQLNLLALGLAPIVLAVLFFYSLTKRMTSGSHLVLGLSLGLSPCGAWVAARGVLDASMLTPVLFGLAVFLWVSGFDIIYACQDVDYDRRRGLHSIPAKVGVKRALHLAAWLHAFSVTTLAVAGWFVPLGVFYGLGIGIIAGLLIWEHRLVRPDDLSRVGVAFLHVNGVISLLVLTTVALDLYL